VIIPAGTWVSIVPARVDWARAGLTARIYYLTEPQQLAALLNPETATLLRGAHRYTSPRDAVDRGPTGPAIEVEETGSVVWDGRVAA
jgi:hypothetical protein